MSLNADKARLASVTKELAMKWNDTKQYWADAKCQEFEHKYLEELFSGVDTATSVIDQLEKIINKIKSDCE